MNICFLDNSSVPYNHNDLSSNKIRGAEKAIINLSLELNNLGHKVTVLNNVNKNISFKNLRWININNYSDSIIYDVAITNNDINNFRKVKSYKKIAISHSIQTFEKFLRKKQLISFLKYKPKVFLLSKYHKNKRPFFLRMFGSDIISWSVDDIFLKTDLHETDHNKAIFTSYTDRNLDMLTNIWKNKIYPKNNIIKLYVTPNNKDLKKFNIFNRNFGNQSVLINDLSTSKVLLIPGHKAELFCIAAAEARELCIPIITMGIGSLKERVEHNKTGFISKNEQEFANYTLEIFSNISLWTDIRNNLINMRNLSNWKKVTKDFVNKI